MRNSSYSERLRSCFQLVKTSCKALIYSNGGGNSPLSINVETYPLTKGIITENYLPDGAKIGVTLLQSSDGAKYDGWDYNNIFYKATGTSSQTWAIDETKEINLSTTEGIAYAYYPYNSSLSDIEQVSISATDGNDYMYAEPMNGLMNSNANATFTMHHALSIIRVNVVRGTYTGTGSITSLKLEGNTLGSSGVMNAKTGGVTASPAELEYASILNLGGTAELCVVPTGQSSTIKFTLEIDGQTYKVTSSNPITVGSGKVYKYILTINSNELLTKTVGVSLWGNEQLVENLDAYEEQKYIGTLSLSASGKATHNIFVNGLNVLCTESNATFSFHEGDVVRIEILNTISGISSVEVNGIIQELQYDKNNYCYYFSFTAIAYNTTIIITYSGGNSGGQN